MSDQPLSKSNNFLAAKIKRGSFVRKKNNWFWKFLFLFNACLQTNNIWLKQGIIYLSRWMLHNMYWTCTGSRYMYSKQLIILLSN